MGRNILQDLRNARTHRATVPNEFIVSEYFIDCVKNTGFALNIDTEIQHIEIHNTKFGEENSFLDSLHWSIVFSVANNNLFALNVVELEIVTELYPGKDVQLSIKNFDENELLNQDEGQFLDFIRFALSEETPDFFMDYIQCLSPESVQIIYEADDLNPWIFVSPKNIKKVVLDYSKPNYF